MNLRLIAAVLPCCLTLAPRPAAADLPAIIVGPEITVFPVSIANRPQRSPIVAPTADGFVVGCNEFKAGLEIRLLGPDGQPTAQAPATISDPDPDRLINQYLPISMAASPNGALAFWSDDGTNSFFFTRVDRTGALIDTPPAKPAGIPVTQYSYAGTAAWNGQAYDLVATGGLISTLVGADGKPTPDFNVTKKAFYEADANRNALSVAGGTTMLVWTIKFGNGVDPIQNYVYASRLDAAGKALDDPPTRIPTPMPPGTYPSKSIGLAHDADGAAGGFLAAWDELDKVITGAYKSQVRTIRIGLDARARDAAPLILREVTGALPDDQGNVVVPIDDVGVAFDGGAYWIVWREASGVWFRRVNLAGLAVDGGASKLVDGPVANVRVSSRGDGRVLLLYVRRTVAGDANSDRVEARTVMVSAPAAVDGGVGVGDGGIVDAAGTSDAAGGDATQGATDGATATTTDATTGSSDASSPGTDAMSTADAGEPASSGGCSCALTVGGSGEAERRGLGWIAFAAGVALARRRRRRESVRGRLPGVLVMAFLGTLTVASVGCSSGSAQNNVDAPVGSMGGHAGNAVDRPVDPAMTDADADAAAGSPSASSDAQAPDAGSADQGATDTGTTGTDAVPDPAADAASDGAASDGTSDTGPPINFLKVKSVVAGQYHACALIDDGRVDGRVKCWGVGTVGQLGNESSHSSFGDDRAHTGNNIPFALLGTGRTAVALAAHNQTTCAILDNGQLKCWGYNINGQLGQGDQVNRGTVPGTMGDSLKPIDLGTGRTARAVGVGDVHACAVLDNGQLKCWGSGAQGATYSALGLEDRLNRGAFPNSMGDKLPAVNLGTGRTAVAVSCGTAHTCAILDNGCVKCWGDASVGQLGQGSTKNWGDEPGEMGDNLACVNLGTGIKPRAIASGWSNTCALFDNGRVKCWGANMTGLLGYGDGNSRGDEPNEMGDALPFVDLGPGRTVTAISASPTHQCAVLDGGEVKCWGENQFGQLGLGDAHRRGGAISEMGAALPVLDLGTGLRTSAVASFYTASCALLTSGRFKCWGQGEQGQHASGVALILGDRAGEMGDALPYGDLGTY